MATITFDQVGLSAGVTDRARTDGLSTGATVTVTVFPSGGTLEFVDVPEGDTTAVSSLTGGPGSWTFSPTSSVYGTWLLQYTSGSVVVRRSFAVRTPVHGLRIPAFNEKASVVATVANGSSHIADSDDNESGTYRGWAPAIKELVTAVESDAPNAHASSHKNGGSDEVATATATANEIPKALASGKLDQAWTSLTQVTATGPATSNPAVNSLVFASVTGGAVTVNLPAGHVAGDQMNIKLTTAATNNCIIDANASETIDGSLTLVLNNDYEWAWLVSNGTNWFQIS